MTTSSGPVLVIEDDPDVRESVVETLSDGGWDVVTAENGAIALSKLASTPRPCLIVLDLRMLEMDGFQFLAGLKGRADANAFPVLVISANESLQEAEHDSGVVGALRKPFSARNLLGWVERYCPR